MREWQVLACVVDADPYINDARRFAKRFRGYVWLTQYRRGKTAREIAISDEETGRSDGHEWTGRIGSVAR